MHCTLGKLYILDIMTVVIGSRVFLKSSSFSHARQLPHEHTNVVD